MIDNIFDLMRCFVLMIKNLKHFVYITSICEAQAHCLYARGC